MFERNANESLISQPSKEKLKNGSFEKKDNKSTGWSEGEYKKGLEFLLEKQKEMKRMLINLKRFE